MFDGEENFCYITMRHIFQVHMVYEVCNREVPVCKRWQINGFCGSTVFTLLIAGCISTGELC